MMSTYRPQKVSNIYKNGRLKTRQEMDEDKMIEEAIAKIRSSVQGNVCCECGGTITKKVQIGRCVYAEPCNHRLYQGTIAQQRGVSE